MSAHLFYSYALLQRRQWVDNIHDEDIRGEDDDVHQQTDTHKVAEAVSARAINKHVSG